ncbi:TPA: hypothetical protein DCQ44_01340 [Candidatus Taylorbacteria bacterium]|nr:hypothetical protein [Candidatus Taylorbacteria bacterium]
MDKLFRRILFFILMPIYGPLGLFMHLTYPWWQNLFKGNISDKILFFILAIIYVPIAGFMNISYSWWTDLHAK